MAKKISFADLFDLNNSQDLEKAIKLIGDMDKVYDQFADGIKQESKAISKALQDNVKAVESLKNQYAEMGGATGKTKEQTIKYAESAEKLFNENQKLTKQQKVLISNEQELFSEKKKVNEQAKETQKLLKQQASLTARLAQAESAEAKEVAKLRLQISEKNKEVKEAAKESLGLISVYQKESKRLNDLRKEYKELALTQGESADATKRKAKEVQELDSKLKRIDKTVGQTQRSVGDYKDQMKEAIQETSFFGVSLGSVQEGLTKLMNPVTAGVAAIGALGAAYLSTGRGARDFQRANDRLSASINSISNDLTDLFGLSGDMGIFESIVHNLTKVMLGFGAAYEGAMNAAARETIRELGLQEQLANEVNKRLLNEAEVQRQIRDEERNSIQERFDANQRLLEIVNEREQKQLDIFNQQRRAVVQALIISLSDAEKEAISGLKTQDEIVQSLLKNKNAELELRTELASIEAEIADIQEDAQGQRSEALINDLGLFRELNEEQLRVATARINEQITLAEAGSRREMELQLQLVNMTEQLMLESAGDFEERRTAIMQEAINQRLAIYKNFQANIQQIEKANPIDPFKVEDKDYISKLEKDVEEQIAIRERLYNREKELSDRNERIIEENEAKKKQNYIDAAWAGIDAINGLFERRVQAKEEELTLLQEKNQRELELAEGNAEGQEIIRRRQVEQEKQAQREIAEERRKQAIFNKTIAISEIVINTASAIIAALAPPSQGGLGPVAGIPFSIAAGILGAAQTAAVLAQPIPAFAEGTDNAPEGLAWVGEEGREIVVRPNGKAYVTPDEPTLVDMEGGSKVLTNAISENILSARPQERINSDVQTNNDLQKVIGTKLNAENQRYMIDKIIAKENDIMYKQLKDMVFNQPINQFYFEDGDLKDAIKKGNTTVKNANKKYKFSR
jgi:hypothetical protein